MNKFRAFIISKNQGFSSFKMISENFLSFSYSAIFSCIYFFIPSSYCTNSLHQCLVQYCSIQFRHVCSTIKPLSFNRKNDADRHNSSSALTNFEFFRSRSFIAAEILALVHHRTPLHIRIRTRILYHCCFCCSTSR